MWVCTYAWVGVRIQLRMCVYVPMCVGVHMCVDVVCMGMGVGITLCF